MKTWTRCSMFFCAGALLVACGSSDSGDAPDGQNGGVDSGSGGGSNGGGGAMGIPDTSRPNETGGAASSDAAETAPRDAASQPKEAAPDVVVANHPCKRGIAANIAPGAAFSAGVGWWYNWAATASAPNDGVSFVPMAWDEASVNAAFPAGSPFILGFNEPNFKAQANLTAEAAAAQWKTLQSNARAAGVPLVSPAVNFCGPAANCNGTDPYAYLKAFFAACTDCRVDYVAVHWYNCDLPSLRDYLEPGGSLEGFEQFNRPIWLTEFACAIGGDTSVAGQEAYMQAAIPYLESNPHVFRYSWFSATPIPNARLLNDDGSPTALGLTYIGLDGDCHR